MPVANFQVCLAGCGKDECLVQARGSPTTSASVLCLSCMCHICLLLVESCGPDMIDGRSGVQSRIARKRDGEGVLRPRAAGGFEVEVHDILSAADRAEEVNGLVRALTYATWTFLLSRT